MELAVKRRQGFTLVELLVVIGIIAILMGILIPALSKARKSSFDVKCRSNLKEISNATRMYANDNSDHYPDGYTLGGGFTRVAPGLKSPGDPFAQPEIFGLPALYQQAGYLKNIGVWVCPSARPETVEWGNSYMWALLGGLTIQSVQKPIESNIARWTSLKRGRAENNGVYFVYDNFTNYPWTSGSRTTSSSGTQTFPVAEQILPHFYAVKKTDIGVRQGSINVLFIDGHVGVAVYSTKGGANIVTKVREP